MTLSTGDKAPIFELPATGGGAFDLSTHLGKRIVVLYFYPRDSTPGCTKEGCTFRQFMPDFEEVAAAVAGISADSIKSHEKFAAKQSFNFPLLSDADNKVCEAYGVWKEKNMYGKKFMGIERSTFVVGLDGTIAAAWRKVKVAGHVEEVFEAVKALKEG